MGGYGQFCSVARAHEALGGRWTVLVIRELLCGSSRFNDIRRGIPRISRSMLSERLRALCDLGVAERLKTARGPEYRLTEAGREAAGLVVVLGEWGQRWLPRRAEDEDVDLEPLLIDMQRRLRGEALPKQPVVIRIDVEGFATRFLMLKAPEGALCHHNPGFPEGLRLKTPLPALIAWWRGDANFVEAQRRGLRLEGPRAMAREFPEWFDRYLFAPVASMAKTS